MYYITYATFLYHHSKQFRTQRPHAAKIDSLGIVVETVIYLMLIHSENITAALLYKESYLIYMILVYISRLMFLILPLLFLLLFVSKDERALPGPLFGTRWNRRVTISFPHYSQHPG